MTLQNFVNELVRQTNHLSDETLLGAPIFVRTEQGDFEVSDVSVRKEPVSGMTVAVVHAGSERT